MIHRCIGCCTVGDFLTNTIGTVVRALQFQRQTLRDEVELLVEDQVHLQLVVVIVISTGLTHGIGHRCAGAERQYTGGLALGLQNIVYIVVSVRDTGDNVFAVDKARAAERRCPVHLTYHLV